MNSVPVIVELEAAVATVRLNEPDRRNALSPAIRESLEREVPRLVNDPAVRCILVTGSGKSFCSGGDLRSLDPDATPYETRRRLAKSYAWLERLIAAEKPVIAAVNGPAVGAGFGLAMAADIVLAADAAWFLPGFASVGVVADYGLGYTLPRAIGSVRAKDILLTGRRVEAGEAAAIGMVTRVFPIEDLMDEAMLLARQLAAGPTVALGLTAALIDSGSAASIHDHLQAEGFAQASAFGTADFREGMDAFLTRRQPRFRGC